MSESKFDYGDRRADGQFEHHPTKLDGDYKTTIRSSYSHEKCGGVTTMPHNIAETYAKDPTYYEQTFCIACGGYFLIAEFFWIEEGKMISTRLGEV